MNVMCERVQGGWHKVPYFYAVKLAVLEKISVSRDTLILFKGPRGGKKSRDRQYTPLPFSNCELVYFNSDRISKWQLACCCMSKSVQLGEESLFYRCCINRKTVISTLCSSFFQLNVLNYPPHPVEACKRFPSLI